MRKIIHFMIYIALITSTQLMAVEEPQYDYGYDEAGNRKTLVYDDGLDNFGPPPPDQEEPVTGELGESQITVYPNPTDGQVQVKITNLHKEGHSSLELRDMAGRSLITKKDLKEMNELDMTDLVDGIYFIRVKLGKQILYWKIMKK